MISLLASASFLLSLCRCSLLNVKVSENIVDIGMDFGRSATLDLNDPNDYTSLTQILLAPESCLVPSLNSESLIEVRFKHEFDFFDESKEMIAESFIINLDLSNVYGDCSEDQKLELLETVFKMSDDAEVRHRAYTKLVPENIENFSDFIMKLDRNGFSRVAEYAAARTPEPQVLIDLVFESFDRPEWIRPHGALLREADLVTSNSYLIKAVRNGFTELTKYLITELGFNASIEVDKDRKTLLHIVPARASIELVALLLCSVGNITTQDVLGETFLFVWIEEEYPAYFFRALFSSPHLSSKVLKFLINAKNKYQTSPLALILLQKRYELLLMFLRNGADVDGVDVPVRKPEKGFHLQMQMVAPVIPGAYSQIARPPLDYAVYTNDALAARILLNEHQGRFDQLNAHGESALIVAARFGSPCLVRMLLESGKVPLDIIKPSDKKTAKQLARNAEIAAVFEDFHQETK